jgi:hypothetical protein
MKITFLLLFYFSLVIVFNGYNQNAGNKTNTSPVKLEIQINTIDSSIRINKQILANYNITSIQKIFGKPSRIEEDKFDSYIEEFPLKEGESRTIISIKVVNYYYIYDQLGIMFYTQNGEVAIKEPTRLNVHFKNKRMFTNTKGFPFIPKNNFTGVFCINGDTISTDKNLIPKNVNYRTSEFDLFHTQFTPTSYTTIIDGIYSYKSKPYLQLYLDNEKSQRISYIVVF